jgi:hypothetical protein
MSEIELAVLSGEPGQSRIDLVGVCPGNVVRTALDGEQACNGRFCSCLSCFFGVSGPTHHNADDIAPVGN